MYKYLNLGDCEILKDTDIYVEFDYNENKYRAIVNSENLKSNVLRGGNNILNEVNTKNYGDFCGYSVTINNKIYDSWKIFYKDDENVYLIMNEYAQVNALGSKFKANWMPGTSTNAGYTGEKDEYVSLLTNSELWNDFCDSNYANYANGASTLEMWVRSWNQKYGKNGIKSSEDRYCNIYANETESGKYYIGYTPLSNRNKLNFSYTMNEEAETDSKLVEDSLYFIDDGVYMLASLSENEFNTTGDSRWDNLSFPYFTIAYRTICARNANGMGYGYRPIICLRNDLKAYYYIDNNETYWILEKNK